MRQWPNKWGYSVVHLGSGPQYFIHRLVAEAFIPNPDHKPQVNHKDGCKSNNSAENLEWVTASENIRHAFETGLKQPTAGMAHGMSILTDDDVATIRAASRKRGSGRKLALEYGVSEATISVVRSGRRWKHIGGAS